jgi:hypothetical protein
MTMSDEQKIEPTERQLLEEMHRGLASHFERIEPLLKLAEGWARTKASLGKWGKK